jgi:hypothetical protein
MRKNVTNDIVPAKKTIRDIELPSRIKETTDISKKIPKYGPKDDPFTRPVTINTPKIEPEEEIAPIRIEPTVKAPVPPVPPQFSYPHHESGGSKKKYLYIFGVIAVLVAAFAVSTFFKSATVTITPIQQDKTINETFSAKKDVTSNGLSYQVVTVTKDIETSVDPKDITSEQKVERKAKGTIVIYNNFGPAEQKLVATTRFQTPEGLIYRLVNAVTVPGKTTKDGKSIPGSVEAEVVADAAGPNYNVGLKDFTIPGLKSDQAKYKEMYARSKTEMTGGFSGMEKVVTKDVLQKAESEMENSLKTVLSKDITSQIPADYILFKESLSYKFEPSSTSNGSNGLPAIKKKGVASAIIFDRKQLTKAVLTKVLPDANSDLIKITNLDDLVFAFQADATNTATVTSINFSLTGDADFVWVVDELKLKNDLLGLSKTNANSVMSAYPSIKEAWVMTKPFWNNRIPTDPKQVTIVNSLTK